MFSIFVFSAFLAGVLIVPILFIAGCIVKDLVRKSLLKKIDCPECHATISINELCPFCTDELVLKVQEN
jgi:hypothetical protein